MSSHRDDEYNDGGIDWSAVRWPGEKDATFHVPLNHDATVHQANIPQNDSNISISTATSWTRKQAPREQHYENAPSAEIDRRLDPSMIGTNGVSTQRGGPMSHIGSNAKNDNVYDRSGNNNISTSSIDSTAGSTKSVASAIEGNDALRQKVSDI